MRRPRMSDYLANWNDSDAPLHVKLGQALRNNATKLRTGSSCCGRHGEPGC